MIKKGPFGTFFTKVSISPPKLKLTLHFFSKQIIHENPYNKFWKILEK